MHWAECLWEHPCVTELSLLSDFHWNLTWHAPFLLDRTPAVLGATWSGFTVDAWRPAKRAPQLLKREITAVLIDTPVCIDHLWAAHIIASLVTSHFSSEEISSSVLLAQRGNQLEAFSSQLVEETYVGRFQSLCRRCRNFIAAQTFCCFCRLSVGLLLNTFLTNFSNSLIFHW